MIPRTWKRTQQTHEILSRGSGLQLFPLRIDQYSGDAMGLVPVLPELDLSRGLTPFKIPGEDAAREPLHGILEKEKLFGWVSECFVATKDREKWYLEFERLRRTGD